ncbi:MAG: universal stress protein [Actinomycetota bacterium]
MDRLKVLVPTRGSLPALRACQACGRLLADLETDVRLLYVMSPELYPYPYGPEGELDLALPEYVQNVNDLVERSLAQPRRVFESAGHKVQLTHRYGGAADQILDEIREWEPDLVVMGRWWAHAPERWVRGSIFERVMCHAAVPTLVVSYNPKEEADVPQEEVEALT